MVEARETKETRFTGFTEIIPAREERMNYNILTGELAEAVLERAENHFREQFPGFPGLEGTLKIVEANGRKELAGSNLPVLAALNSVDLRDFGIQLCDEVDLANVYNDEVRRINERREPFFQSRFWFDIALMRNPYSVQKELMPWEAELDKQITDLSGEDAIVSVPYRVLVPVISERDNAPFGRISSYGVGLSQNNKNTVRVIEITPQEAQEGYNFVKLNKTTAFPVKGEGRKFYGVSKNRRFSRLCVCGNLNAVCDEFPLFSSEYGRVVFKSAEGAEKK